MEQLTYRPVTQFDELQKLSDLQGTAWPLEMFTSAAHMKAAVLHGGSVIAVYDGSRPAGFCYGFAAYDGKAPYLHSHMMVVHPDYRDRGLGTKLKLEQRLWAIDRGYKAITWTYDPLQLRNGFLNVCKLGGMVGAYMREVYGVDQYADPSDRFLIRWELSSPRVEAAARGEYAADPRWEGYPVLVKAAVKEGEQFSTSDVELTEDGYLLAVPRNAVTIKQCDPAAIVAWKQRLRTVCEPAFSKGYRIVGLLPGDAEMSYYVLEGARGL